MQIYHIILLVCGAAFLIMAAALFFISRKSQKVMNSLLDLLMRPERAQIKDAARVLQTALGNEINLIEQSFKSMQETLANQISSAAELKKDLGERTDTLQEIADNAAKKISVLTQRLENTAAGLDNIVNSDEWSAVQNSATRFAERIAELLREIDSTSNDTVEKTLELQNHIEGWIESGKTLSEQLGNESSANTAQMNELTGALDDMRKNLAQLSETVKDGFVAVKNSAADYESVMKTNDGLMGQQINKMEAFSKQAKTTLNTQMNTLANTANVVGGQIRIAESSIEKQVGKLAAASNQLMESSANIESAARTVSGELTMLSNKFNSEIKEFSGGITSELSAVAVVANTTLENTRTSAGAFADSVRAMATGVRETLIEMNEAHEHLTTQSENLVKMSAETTAQIAPLSELIEKYYTALPGLSQGSAEMGENLENLISNINDKIEILNSSAGAAMAGITESSKKMEILSSQSRQQMMDLLSDYADAAEKMQDLNKQIAVARATAPMEAMKTATPSQSSYGRISSQDFLKQTEKSLAKMHEQSLDLTKATGAEIPDTVWQKYHGGDTAIFSKWLAKMLGMADKKKVQEMIKKDSVFRSQASQFVRSFEKILDGANQTDNGESLKNILLKTELGQIYTRLN